MFNSNIKHTALIGTVLCALTVFGAGAAFAADDMSKDDSMSNNANGTEMQEDKAGAGQTNSNGSSMSSDDSMSGDEGMSHDDSMSGDDSMSSDEGMSHDDSMESEDK